VKCNAPLVDVSSEAVRDQLPPRVKAERTEFRTCSECGRIYWKGTHYEAMARFLESAVEAARRPLEEQR
jgi:uncharacterized protein with PIN domain